MGAFARNRGPGGSAHAALDALDNRALNLAGAVAPGEVLGGLPVANALRIGTRLHGAQGSAPNAEWMHQLPVGSRSARG